MIMGKEVRRVEYRGPAFKLIKLLQVSQCRTQQLFAVREILENSVPGL